MQLLEELEEFISSLHAKHPAVAISFSTKVRGKPEAQESCNLCLICMYIFDYYIFFFSAIFSLWLYSYHFL